MAIFGFNESWIQLKISFNHLFTATSMLIFVNTSCRPGANGCAVNSRKISCHLKSRHYTVYTANIPFPGRISIINFRRHVLKKRKAMSMSYSVRKLHILIKRLIIVFGHWISACIRKLMQKIQNNCNYLKSPVEHDEGQWKILFIFIDVSR